MPNSSKLISPLLHAQLLPMRLDILLLEHGRGDPVPYVFSDAGFG